MIGLGRKIVEQGHTVRFTTATGLLSVLGKAESEGTLTEKLTEFAKPRLLIIDELGYLPFVRRAAHLFFELVNRRYERGSLLITTNQRVSEWGTVFGDEVLATAILDRLLHHSHTLKITGESYRLREKRKSGLFRTGLATAVPEPDNPKADEREDFDIGAQSHGPLTRCLRFAVPVTRTPRKTRSRPLGKLCRAGLVTRRVPTKGFRL